MRVIRGVLNFLRDLNSQRSKEILFTTFAISACEEFRREDYKDELEAYGTEGEDYSIYVGQKGPGDGCMMGEVYLTVYSSSPMHKQIS